MRQVSGIQQVIEKVDRLNHIVIEILAGISGGFAYVRMARELYGAKRAVPPYNLLD